MENYMQKKLNDAAVVCLKELDTIGVNYGKINSFSINTRASNLWGKCKSNPNGGFDIEISQRLLADESSVDGLKNTIIHEILHTCYNCQNHGRQWKYWADKVNQTYGYGIKRTSSAEEKGVTLPDTELIVKHKAVCTGCGQVITRTRESKFTKHPELYRCGICNGKFELVF